MDRLKEGPEWSSHPIASQSVSNSHDPSDKTTANLTVKSKLRKLAESRRQSKEFGSNDSLHLTPLHRSLSDPWLLKGIQQEKGTNLDLSKSASNTNLFMEKKKLDSSHMMSNGLTSSGSESYLHPAWQQQLELMQKSVSAYHKMATMEMSNGMNPYLQFTGNNYPGVPSYSVLGGKSLSKDSLLDQDGNVGVQSSRDTKTTQASQSHRQQNPSVEIPTNSSTQHHNETTVHWKPTNDHLTKQNFQQDIQFSHQYPPGQDLGHIHPKNSNNYQQPVDQKPTHNISSNKGQSSNLQSQFSVDLSKRQPKPNKSFTKDIDRQQHLPSAQYSYNLSNRQQNEISSRYPSEFNRSEQDDLPSLYPMDFSKGSNTHLENHYSTGIRKETQTDFSKQHPTDLSKFQQPQMSSQYPMDFSKGRRHEMESQYPTDLTKAKPMHTESPFPSDFSQEIRNGVVSYYPNDYSKEMPYAKASCNPADLSKGKQNETASYLLTDYSKHMQYETPSPYHNDYSKGMQNEPASQNAATKIYSTDLGKEGRNETPSHYPTDFSKQKNSELPSQFPKHLSKVKQDEYVSQYPADLSKINHSSFPNSEKCESSMKAEGKLPDFSTGFSNFSFASQSSMGYSDKPNAIYGNDSPQFAKKPKQEISKPYTEPSKDMPGRQTNQPFYPVDNYLNGAFYNMPPPNKEIKKKKTKKNKEHSASDKEKKPINLNGIFPSMKGDNLMGDNPQFPHMPYPYLPNYYSDPYMMKALIAHQKSYMTNSAENFNQLKRKSSLSKDTDKPKIKRTKKSLDKLKANRDKIVDLGPKNSLDTKCLSTDVKKSLKANSEALNQIQNRVQEILNSAASEIRASGNDGSKLNDLASPSSLPEIQMDNDFLDAHESLLISKPKEPCCGSCDKLGMRFSPLCEEKSKTQSSSDIPNLISDNKNISSKSSAITSYSNGVNINSSQNNIQANCDNTDAKNSVFKGLDPYSFSDEYSDMKVSSDSLPLPKNKSATSSPEMQLKNPVSILSSTGTNLLPEVPEKNGPEKEMDISSQLVKNPNVTSTSVTWSTLQEAPNNSKDEKSASQISNQVDSFMNGLNKDVFRGLSTSCDVQCSNVSYHSGNIYSSGGTSFSNIDSKTLSVSVSTCISSTSTSASVLNNLVSASEVLSTSSSKKLEIDKIGDTLFKIPSSAKSLSLNSAINRLEKNLSSENFDSSFENDEKLEDLSELLDTTGNSDDEKENLFQNSSSKSFEEIGNILHDIKPNEPLPESGLDQLAWVADHVQKIKGKVIGDDEDDEMMTRLKNNEKLEIPNCGCRGPGYIPSEDIEGPYYTHLGASRSIQGIRELMEERTGMSGKAIRIEKIRYTGKEGKSSQGCPIAKWIIRRSNIDEKYLCVVKQRPGHFCETAVIIVVAVAWEGIEQNTAADIYDYLRNTLTENGFETERRCGTNERKTCACQGINLMKRGASFSFGCSWSMYFNGCKFARSHTARKFKLKDSSKEEELESRFQKLATDVAPLYKQVAPDAYNNQITFEDKAIDCRLGLKEGRPFTGVTSCVDFCAHAHKDLHNMNNGSTVVVTLTKHRGLGKPDDEQLHVLPLYVMDMSDEQGSADAQYEKVKSGALEILNHYQMEARIRATPLTPSRRKKKGEKKGSPGRKKGSTNKLSSPVRAKAHINNSQDSNLSSSDLYFQSGSDKSNSGTPKKPSKSSKNHNPYEDLMNMASKPEFNDLYDSFWSYFYSFGSFPPADFMASMSMKAKNLVKKSENQNQISNNGQQSSDINHKEENQTNSKTLSGDITHAEKMCTNFSGIVNDIQNMSSNFKNGALDHNTSDVERQQNAVPMDLSFKQEPFTDNLTRSSNSFQCSNSNKLSEESKPNTSYESPLHLLSEAVSMRTNDIGSNFPSKELPQNTQPNHLGETSINTAAHNNQIWGQNNFGKIENGISDQFDSPLKQSVQTSAENPDVIDQNILKCEMEYNENAFADSEVGGVAIALSHGSVLFEVAKRELHATTGLKNPNRFNPTRISLVFYQHKNLINEHHGMYVYEKKCERMRQKRLQEVMNGNTPSVKQKDHSTTDDKVKTPGKKKKPKKDFAKTSAAQYKYMWDTTVRRAETQTTETVTTCWIKPQPMVTGPYQRWV